MDDFEFNIQEYILWLIKAEKPDLSEEWLKVFKEMAVHTRKRVPDDLLLKTRPNEDPDVLAYRIANYEPITYGSMNRALDQIYRMLSGSGYSFEVEEAVSEYLKERVFTDEQGNLYSFREYMESIPVKRGIEDPNGFIVWVPDGEGIIDSSKNIRAKPVIVLSEQLYEVCKDVFTWLSHEQSSYMVGNSKRKGKIYYTITKDEFWKISQTGTKTYTGELIYKHSLDEVPAIIFGGDKNANGYFESFFAPYNAFGNQAIRNFSDWQGIMVTSAFPIREEFQIECSVAIPTKTNVQFQESTIEETFEGGGEGKAFIPKSELSPMPKNPYGTIRRKVPMADGTGYGEAILPADIPSVRFIYPDQTVAEYSGKSWDMLLTKAEDALHLNLGSGKNLSGEAKDKDLENRYAMIDKISKRFFDGVLFNSLRYVSAYFLNIKAKDTVVQVIKPADFKIKSQEDYIEEMGQLREKKAPIAFLSGVTTQLASKMFAGDRVMLKIFDVLPFIDPLAIYTNEEKVSMSISGNVTKPNIIRSIYAFPILQNISRTMGPDVFIKATDDVISKKFDEALVKYLPEPTIVLFDEEGNPIPPGPPAPPIPE